jgi:hypothetical protein
MLASSQPWADALVWGLTELFPRVIASEMPFEKKPEVIGRPLLMRYGRWGQ